MKFFNDVDNLKVVERNIQRLQGIEEKQSKEILKVFIAGRERIKESLLSVRVGSFTEAQLRISLQQVDLIISKMDSVSLKQNKNSSEMVAEQSIDDLGREVSRFSKKFEGISRVIPIDEIIVSMDSTNILVNRFKSSLNTYSQKMRDIIQRELTQSIISSEASISVISRINDDLKIKEWEVLRIARTELHNIYNAGKLEGMSELKKGLLPDLQKALFHPMDNRTAQDSKKARSLNLIVDIDKPFKYTFKGSERIFFNPPDRPNDRSIIVPYTKAWGNN